MAPAFEKSQIHIFSHLLQKRKSTGMFGANRAQLPPLFSQLRDGTGAGRWSTVGSFIFKENGGGATPFYPKSKFMVFFGVKWGKNRPKIDLKSTKNRSKIDQNINFQLFMPNGTLNNVILCDENKIGKNIFWSIFDSKMIQK